MDREVSFCLKSGTNLPESERPRTSRALAKVVVQSHAVSTRGIKLYHYPRETHLAARQSRIFLGFTVELCLPPLTLDF